MLDPQSQGDIRRALFRTFEVITNSGVIGPHRDYVLALLALKYLADREPYAVRFGTLLESQSRADIGTELDQALAAVGDHVPLLNGIDRVISFVSPTLGHPKERTRMLCELLRCFTAPDLNFSGDAKLATASVAFASKFLISEVAETTGKRGNDFFTPPELSTLIARLVHPEAGESICDPCCGSGTLLLTCGQLARESSGHSTCRLYGQEKNGNTWALAKINLFLHGEQDAQIAWGDTLRDPQLHTGDQLQTFDVVVSSPPFNLKDWGHENAARDPYRRYDRGIPPRAAGDYAFISHMVSTLDPHKGRMAVVVSLGVLSRSGTEQKIREQLLQENLIDAVIALPAKLFAHTSIPVALMVLRKQKPDHQVVLIDASRLYAPGKTQNILREADLFAIESACRNRYSVDGFARVVPVTELLSNESSLSVVRYVKTAETIESVDIAALRVERAQLKAELAVLEAQLATLLEEADLG